MRAPIDRLTAARGTARRICQNRTTTPLLGASVPGRRSRSAPRGERERERLGGYGGTLAPSFAWRSQGVRMALADDDAAGFVAARAGNLETDLAPAEQTAHRFGESCLADLFVARFLLLREDVGGVA